jgi:hypothetical protein
MFLHIDKYTCIYIYLYTYSYIYISTYTNISQTLIVKSTLMMSGIGGPVGSGKTEYIDTLSIYTFLFVFVCIHMYIHIHTYL